MVSNWVSSCSSNVSTCEFPVGRLQEQEFVIRTKAVSSWGLDISPGLVTMACFVGVFEPEADDCGEALAGVDAGVTFSGRAVDGI